jgi:tetratricopeptide (TPR) repeat protein
MMVLYHLTLDYYFLGDWDEVVAVIDEMREIAPDSRWTELSGDWFPGPAVHAQRGGTPTLPEGDFSTEELADVQARAGYESARATIFLALGRPAEALEAGEVAWGLREALGPHSFSKEGLFAALEASYALSDFDRVERLLGDVRALAPGITAPTLPAQSARYEAKLAASRGEHERVEASFAAAETAFRKLEMPFPLAEVRLEHAEWLTEQGRAGDASTLRTEARATFERLRAQPSLERLDRLDHEAAVEAVPSS